VIGVRVEVAVGKFNIAPGGLFSSVFQGPVKKTLKNESLTETLLMPSVSRGGRVLPSSWRSETSTRSCTTQRLTCGEGGREGLSSGRLWGVGPSGRGRGLASPLTHCWRVKSMDAGQDLVPWNHHAGLRCQRGVDGGGNRLRAVSPVSG